MASLKIAEQSVDRAIADAAHTELTKLVESFGPDAVGKQLDAVLHFDEYLKDPALQKTKTMVEDFLDNKGKNLAADFLQNPEAKLERSYLVLYCARQSRERSIGLGKVTIFLALGSLSPANGLPILKDYTSKNLGSGDALLVAHDLPQMLNKTTGGGFALVSDWTS